jgi:hypothetical protein
MFWPITLTIAFGGAIAWWVLVHRPRQLVDKSAIEPLSPVTNPALPSNSSASSTNITTSSTSASNANLPLSALAAAAIDTCPGVDSKHDGLAPVLGACGIELHECATPVSQLFEHLHREFGPLARFYVRQLPVISVEDGDVLKVCTRPCHTQQMLDEVSHTTNRIQPINQPTDR